MKVINLAVVVTDEEYNKMVEKTKYTWISPEAQLCNTVMCSLVKDYNLNAERASYSSVDLKVLL